MKPTSSAAEVDGAGPGSVEPADDEAQLAEWTVVRRTRGWFRGLDLRELWAYREVGRALVARELKARYKQAALGVGWAVVQPLLGVVLFSLVFGELGGLPSDGVAYPVFVLAGLVLWSYYSGAVESATWALTDDPELVTKVYFPRVLAVAAPVVSRLVELAVGLVVLGAVMAAYGVAPGLALLLLPLWIMGVMAVTLGVGCLFAALHVRFRDVGHALGLLLQLWLFATPVVFAASAVDGVARVVLSLNPLTVLVDGWRWSVLAGPAPPPVDLLSVLTGALAIGGGIAFFQRVERRFADMI
jgi:lipopolysaccharide transport system permease protein